MEHPENTLAAFAAAALAGADLVELDVRVTADGVPIVLHDQDLGRTTDRRGPVHLLSFVETRRADASGGQGPRQVVPTLAEVLDLLTQTGTGVDIEIKNLPGEGAYEPGGERIVRAVLGVVAEAAFPHPIIISSFDRPTIARVRQLGGDVPTGLLTLGSEGLPTALEDAIGEGHAWLLPHAAAFHDAGEDLLREARRRAVAVGTWTVDDEATMARLFSWGVDALATNDPALGVAVRDRVASQA